MVGILLDNHLSGMLELLDSALQRSGWAELQLLQFASLSQAGLAYDAIDREVWRTAQASGMIVSFRRAIWIFIISMCRVRQFAEIP